MDMNEMTPEKRLKTFWQRPEGKVGAFFLVGAAIIFIIYSSTILAFIIGLLQNMITAIVLFVVLGALLYIILDPKFRALVWYMYRSFMRWVTGVFVQIDPIKILESYIEYLYNNLREMNTHIAKLKGQVSKLQGVIETNKAEMEQNLKMAEQAKKAGNMELVAINTRQFGRLKESNTRYNNLLGKMEILYKVLSKIHKNSGYLIKDTENEVRMRKQEYEAIKAGHSAMKSAMNIIQGDPDKKMIFDMATEAVVDDVHTKIGEMERFIELSGSFIDSIDLQNGVYEQSGLDILEKMDKEGVSFLLGDHPADIPGLEKTPEVDIENTKDVGNISDYSNLFK
jgi:phage shock protein A